MPDVLLTATDQSALRALVAAGPVAGMPPAQKVLENVAILIPCDALTVGIADASGCLLDCVCLPTGTHARGLRVNEGPHPVGIVHMSLDPEDRDRLAAHGLTDALVVCTRNGTKYVAWLSLDRSKQPFSERDLSVLRMIAPALERLLRNQPSRALPATLTVQERKVLQLVALGTVQHRDSRPVVRRAQHRAKAPRAHLPQARCDQPTRCSCCVRGSPCSRSPASRSHRKIRP